MTTKKAAATKSGKLLQWRRESVTGGLALYLTNEDGEYIRYDNSQYFQPDYLMENNYGITQSGLRTAQYLLTQGYEYDQDLLPADVGQVGTKTAAQEAADQKVNSSPVSLESLAQVEAETDAQ